MAAAGAQSVQPRHIRGDPLRHGEEEFHAFLKFRQPHRRKTTSAAAGDVRPQRSRPAGHRRMVQLQAILHTLCMIGSMGRTCSISADQEDRPVATASTRGHRTVPAWYSGTVSWLAAESRDQWPVANASSVGNVAASHRFHSCADREIHLPEVLGWTATQGMGPWC